MKVALVSDTHLHNYQAFSTIVNGYNSRLLTTIKYLDWAWEEALTRGCDHFAHLGDFFESKNHIDIAVWNKGAAAIARIYAAYPQAFIVPGNHDIADENRECTLQSFEDTVNVVEAPLLYDGILYVPYDSVDNIRRTLNKYKSKEVIVLGHFPVIGTDMGHGNLCSKGITMDELKGFKQVLLGHHHKPEYPYVGALVPTDAKAPNTAGCMVILDTETGEYERVWNDAPKFVTWTANEVDNGAARQGLPGGNYITIVGHAKNDEQMTTLLTQHGAKGVRFSEPVDEPIDQQVFKQVVNLDDVARELASKPPEGLEERELMLAWDGLAS